MSTQEEKDLHERYPHFNTYKACQSKAFMSGSFTLLVATACTYICLDHYFHRFKPAMSRNWLIAGPLVLGTASAYVVTMRRSMQCQRMFMAMEERHSVFNPAQERLARRIQEDEES